jgi:zinc protease
VLFHLGLRDLRHDSWLALVAALLAGAACAAPKPSAARGIAVTASPRPFPFPTVERTLPNGLRVFVVQHDSPGLVAYYTVVRTGSRNEVEPGKSGFAHFFEHMMFRGTPSYPTEKYNAVIKAMGADSNAFTSNDMTVYHILAGVEALPTIVTIESDRFQNLAFSEAEFRQEARAVLGEYNKGASNPIQPMVEALYDNAFTTHTYKHTTLGFLRDIVEMPNQYAYARQFFDRYYRPDNVILLVVGDLDAQQLMPLIERHYGKWGPGPDRPAVPSEPPQTEEKRVRVPWSGVSMPMLLIGHHAPAFAPDSLDSAALEVLAELVFAERGPLFRRLVLDEQKVDTLHGGYGRYHDPNLFTVLARVKDAKDLAYVERAITAEIARVADEGTAATTLAQVVARTRYAFAAQLATADKTALVAAEFLALTGRLSAIDATFATLARVTNDDVKRVAATYFVPRARTVVTLAPEAP